MNKHWFWDSKIYQKVEPFCDTYLAPVLEWLIVYVLDPILSTQFAVFKQGQLVTRKFTNLDEYYVVVRKPFLNYNGRVSVEVYGQSSMQIYTFWVSELRRIK